MGARYEDFQGPFYHIHEPFGPFPGRGPGIAMVGKSNVGKSSTINRLCRQKKLAKTSGEPGKTRLINLYDLNEGQLILCDLPGYGFARAPQTEKKKWAAMIEGYLCSENLRHVLLLVDIRHEPTQDDVAMVAYLRHYGITFSVLANKCDKLSKAQRGNALQLICRTLVVQPWEVIPFSAWDGTGVEDVMKLLEEVISQNVQ